MSETTVLQVVVEWLAILIAFGGAWFKSRTAVLLRDKFWTVQLLHIAMHYPPPQPLITGNQLIIR